MFYRGVPVVDLMPQQKRRPLRLFGAEGKDLLVRVVLVLVWVAAAGAGLTFRDLDARNVVDRTSSVRASASADAKIDEGLIIQDEIDALRATGDVSGDDYAFLLGNPGALVAAVQSVFALEVNGILITNLETEQSSSVLVTLEADSNAAALEWLRLIPTQLGVQRVLSFDSVASEETLIYEAVLVAGGAS